MRVAQYLNLVLIFLFSCKFEVSPYSANISSYHLNSTNLAAIKKNESTNPNYFKIALVSDTHNHYKEFKKIINHINANGPYDFVVINGDITTIGLLDEFLESKERFERFKYPFLVTIGNHDLLTNGGKIFDKIFGATDFSFLYKNVTFILYNSNNWESPGSVPNISWVRDQISSGTNIFISHVPPDDRDRFSNEMIQEWEELTQKHNVPFIFSGHNHNPAEAKFGASTLITIGSPPHGQYSELILDQGVVYHQKIDI